MQLISSYFLVFLLSVRDTCRTASHLVNEKTHYDFARPHKKHGRSYSRFYLSNSNNFSYFQTMLIDLLRCDRDDQSLTDPSLAVFTEHESSLYQNIPWNKRTKERSVDSPFVMGSLDSSKGRMHENKTFRYGWTRDILSGSAFGLNLGSTKPSSEIHIRTLKNAWIRIPRWIRIRNNSHGILVGIS